MKTKFITGQLRGSRCIRFVAIIPKSIKKGIPRRYQKTWSLPTADPEFTLTQYEHTMNEESKRWEAKVMAKIANQKQPEPVEQQAQIH